MDRKYRDMLGGPLLNSDAARFKDVPRLARPITWGRMLKYACEVLEALPLCIGVAEWRSLSAAHPDLVQGFALGGGAGYHARRRSAEKALGRAVVPPIAYSECDQEQFAELLTENVWERKTGALDRAEHKRLILQILDEIRPAAMEAFLTVLRSHEKPMPAAIEANMLAWKTDGGRR